jgi:hypothetical protein
VNVNGPICYDITAALFLQPKVSIKLYLALKFIYGIYLMESFKLSARILISNCKQLEFNMLTAIIIFLYFSLSQATILRLTFFFSLYCELSPLMMGVVLLQKEAMLTAMVVKANVLHREWCPL